MSALPQHARRSFAAEPRSVAEARRFARAQLASWDAPELVDSAALVVSELVTNAVVHTGTTTTVELRLDAHALRVDVEDQHPGRGLPTGVHRPAEDAEGGRGLMITSALASSWGVEYNPRSKRVWVVCDRDRPRAEGTDRRTRTSLRSLSVRGTSVAAVELAADGTVTGWDAHAVELFGWRAAQVVGRPWAQLVEPVAGRRPPEGADPGPSGWQGSYGVLGSDGQEVRVFASHAADGHRGTVVLLVPEERRALLEHPSSPAAARSPRTDADPLGLRDDTLLRLAVEDYLPLATERVRDALDADAAYLMIGHEVDDTFEVVAVSGLGEQVRGTRVVAGDPGAPDARTPHLPVLVQEGAHLEVAPLRETACSSLALVPVVVEGRVIGALAVASERHGAFSDDQCVRLQRLADSLALAVDRARLQTSERERRGWLTFVAEAGDLLAGSLDQDMTMAITGQIVVPRLATWCALHLDDERGEPVLHQVWHSDEREIEGLRAALATRRPDALGSDRDPLLAGEVTTMRLVARGRGIGHLTLGRPVGSPLRDDVLLVTESISRRAALAIDNARAHGTLLATGQALQRSLLPPVLPDVPGLDVGVVYEAAGEGAEAGGDFYDLFPVRDGAWGLALGDVSGKGSGAAALTALARYTIRAASFQAGTCVDVLSQLDAAVNRHDADERYLTALFALLTRTADGLTVDLSLGGHPHPLVVRRDGTVEAIGVAGSAVGLLPETTFTQSRHLLRSGDALVAYTDGVTEARSGNQQYGEERLRAVLAGCAGLPAAEIARTVGGAVLAFQGALAHDDTAVVVVSCW